MPNGDTFMAKYLPETLKSKAIFVSKWLSSSRFCYLKDSIYILTPSNFPKGDNLNPAANGDADIEIIFMFRFSAFICEHLAQRLYLKYKYIKALFKATQNTAQF